MKIFLALSSIPNPNGEAIDIVSNEVVNWLSTTSDEVFIQVIIREKKNHTYQSIEHSFNTYTNTKKNLHFKEVIYMGDMQSPRHFLYKVYIFAKDLFMSLPLIRNCVNKSFFPALIVKKKFDKAINSVNPDIIVSIWSWESLSLIYDIKNIPKYIYYGNPDHKPLEAQLESPKLFDMHKKSFFNKMKLYITKLKNKAREIQHLKMMNSCEMVSNNSLVDANYYSQNGHKESLYLQNMWPSKETPSFHEFINSNEIKTVGSVGNLGATGNTFGLYYLGKYLIPELRKNSNKNINIDIYGGGKPRKFIQKHLNHKEINIKGWVEDIESELTKSHSFLVLTNSTGFIVGNTRILLAWSLGLCVIAHSNSCKSMPEIKHNENALIGSSPKELAELVIKCSIDSDYRNKIGMGGYNTYSKYYKSDVVMPKMYEHIKKCHNKFRQ